MTRVLGAPLHPGVGCSIVSEMKRRSTIINASLQLTQKVTPGPQDWYVTLNLLRYSPCPTSKERERLIYVMGNHPYPSTREMSVASP